MNKIIENADRGVTLNKQLAWTMLVALVGAVWWGGSTITKLQASTENLVDAVSETRSTIADERQTARALEARVRALEASATRQNAQFEALSKGMDELKTQQRETNALLRKIAAAEEAGR